MRALPLGLLCPLFVLAAACTKTPVEAPDSAPARKKPSPAAAERPTRPAAPKKDPRIERAQAALLPLKKALKQALTEAMAKGPAHAVTVCQTDAAKLTAAAAKDGAKLGRTSHKLRNPGNAQAEWMRLPYARLREGDESPPPYMLAELPDGAFGYMEPIVTQPLCLTCHGADVPDQVKKILDDKYPRDDARGFRAGELRGAWWVVLPGA